LEKYPKANAVRTADSAQHIIGWKTFFTLDGNLKRKKKKTAIMNQLQVHI
jgi:hypothetical protein